MNMIYNCKTIWGADSRKASNPVATSVMSVIAVTKSDPIRVNIISQIWEKRIPTGKNNVSRKRQKSIRKTLIKLSSSASLVFVVSSNRVLISLALAMFEM